MKRFNRIKVFCASLMMIFCLMSCNLSIGKEKNVKALRAELNNYSFTPSRYIARLRFMDVEKPFHYFQAAEDGCCFHWNTKQTKPVTIRVIWAIVFDPTLREIANYDPYTNKESAPGERWCEAIVPIQQPYPADPKELILEHFPDGSMKAWFSSESKPLDASMFLSDEQVRNWPHLPEGQYCLKEISNPLYGLEWPGITNNRNNNEAF